MTKYEKQKNKKNKFDDNLTNLWAWPFEGWQPYSGILF